MPTEKQRMEALAIGKPLPGDERNTLVWDGGQHVIVSRREAALGWLRWSDANLAAGTPARAVADERALEALRGTLPQPRTTRRSGPAARSRGGK